MQGNFHTFSISFGLVSKLHRQRPMREITNIGPDSSKKIHNSSGHPSPSGSFNKTTGNNLVSTTYI
jgi:hypothetical protein